MNLLLVLQGYLVLVAGGRILAEDKSTPILDCQDIEVYCSEYESLGQGAVIHGFGSATLENESVASNDTEVYNMNISGVTGLATNIVLTFDAQMPDVSELELYLTPPSGMNQIELINSTSYTDPCTSSNMYVCLTDETLNENSLFASPEFCRPTLNAWIGEVQPSDPFFHLV